MGTCCADHVTPLYPQKLALTSPTGGGRSVGIVRVRTKATEFSLYTDGSYIRKRSGRSLGTLKQDSALVGPANYGLGYNSIDRVRCKPFCQELGTRSFRACTAETLEKQQAV